MTRAFLSIVVLGSTIARAQTLPDPSTAAPPNQAPGGSQEPLLPVQADAATCSRLDLTPGALIHARATGPNVLATPIPWTDFEVRGPLVDSPSTVRAMLEPTLQELHTSLSTATLPQLAGLTARFGYQLVGHVTQEMAGGTKLILSLAPLPMVRRVRVHIPQPLAFDTLWRLFKAQLDEEIGRRLAIRVGSYLPWEPVRRECALLEQSRRINEFLFDEGYYDARTSITFEDEETIVVDVTLGDEYHLCAAPLGVTIACPPGYNRVRGVCVDPATKIPNAPQVPEDEIKKVFVHRNCLFGKSRVCLGKQRFTRAQHQEDLEAVRQLFHLRGFPAVRVQSSQSVNRARDRKCISTVLTIDPRRQIQVEFEGHDPEVTSESELRKHLTFDQNGSGDDVEAAASARELTTFLQTRGYFDVHVTYRRDPKDTEPRPGTNLPGVHYDDIVFQIDLGEVRKVNRVEFVGNKVIPSDKLAALVVTKPRGLGSSLFGTSPSATSPELINDQDRIKEAYRREGYPDAYVWASASPQPIGLGDAALTAALVAIDRRGLLNVRFTIEEGLPTLVTRIIVQQEGEKPAEDALCVQVLGELAKELGEPQIAKRAERDKCGATIGNLKFRVDELAATRDRLRDYLFKIGRARSVVDYVATPIGPHRIEVRYTVRRANELKLGKIIIRGAFKTAPWVIRRNLELKEGQPLTSDRLADAARRLRMTGLFDAVNIDMPDLVCERDRQCNTDTINAIVRVEERYDILADISIEGGYSSLNGLFGTARVGNRNLFGRGISLITSGTLGTKIEEVEGTFRLPQYLLKKWFNAEVTGLYRVQDTPRFGELTTIGFTPGITRVLYQRQWSETQSARTLTGGLRYDFRLRSRNVDALRPIGGDMDQPQVAISTRTGSIGGTLEYEARVDRNGRLSPLAPERGLYAMAQASYARPAFYSQDTFLKFSALVSKFYDTGSLFGHNLVLRTDLRYDHGIPLGGAVLLPEVERYFAGGDSTVRGYAEDRMYTELIQVGVPPLGNITQIRVIPAGGNIRVLGSADAQIRIWKILAGALFTDAGLITNQWRTVEVTKTELGTSSIVLPYDVPDLRPSVGMGLRALTPFGIAALEYAVPLRPHLGDDPRGRLHFYFAARAQF